MGGGQVWHKQSNGKPGMSKSSSNKLFATEGMFNRIKNTIYTKVNRKQVCPQTKRIHDLFPNLNIYFTLNSKTVKMFTFQGIDN